MQQQSGLAREADDAEAGGPSPMRRRDKQSRKLTVRLTEQLYDELAVATDRPGVGKSMVVQAALVSFLNPLPAADDPARQRIEDLHARFDSLERNLSTIAETVALHARYHLAVVPPLPEQRQKEACQIGDQRFRILAEQVDRRVRENRPLMQETINRLAAATHGETNPIIDEIKPVRPDEANAGEDTRSYGNSFLETLPPQKLSANPVMDQTTSPGPIDRAEPIEPRVGLAGWHGAEPWSEAEPQLKGWRLILAVFLPFAAGYYLSFLFRTINAAISPALAAEFGLDAASIGLMTSVYFLVLAAAQIPIGAFLDRYGPRRVQSVLLVMAAGGASLFGTATGLSELLLGRTLIGLGVAASLMAGLKAIVIWFPKDRIALVNGCMIMLGSLGAVTATAPTDWLLERAGWRSLFELLTLATVATAGVVYFAVPREVEDLEGPIDSDKKVTVWSVFADNRFLRIAPLSATCIGSSWAFQSLWAAPWLTDVEGLDRPNLLSQLFVMALALSFGALLLGIMAERLRRRGITTEALLAIVSLLFIAAEFAIVLRIPVPSLLPWCVVAAMGAATVLSYAVVAEYFPARLAARANGALNLVHFACAFAIQSGVGFVVGQWSPQDGHYPTIAYQIAFGIGLAVQAAALLWFAVPWLRSVGKALISLLALRENDRQFAAVNVSLHGSILDTKEAAEW
jgi:MFS family permease